MTDLAVSPGPGRPLRHVPRCRRRPGKPHIPCTAAIAYPGEIYFFFFFFFLGRIEVREDDRGHVAKKTSSGTFVAPARTSSAPDQGERPGLADEECRREVDDALQRLICAVTADLSAGKRVNWGGCPVAPVAGTQPLWQHSAAGEPQWDDGTWRRHGRLASKGDRR